MKKFSATFGVIVVLMFCITSCTNPDYIPKNNEGDVDSNEDHCPVGSKNCRCYGNNTCNDVLECINGVCRNAEIKVDGDKEVENEEDWDMPIDGDYIDDDFVDVEFDKETILSDGDQAAENDTDIDIEMADGDTDIIEADIEAESEVDSENYLSSFVSQSQFQVCGPTIHNSPSYKLTDVSSGSATLQGQQLQSVNFRMKTWVEMR